MNPQRFKQLVIPLSRRLYLTALRITGDAADAEDAVQDAMERMWEHRDRLEALDSVAAYAVTMTRNRAIDLMKSRGRFASEEEIPCGSAAEGTPERDAVERDDVRYLLSAIDALPANQATVMRMRHVEGLDSAEIEAATGLSAGNIRVLLSRARTSIRNYFKTL